MNLCITFDSDEASVILAGFVALRQIPTQLEQIMADFAAFQSLLDKLTTDIQGLENPGTSAADQAKIDDLTKQVTDLQAKVDAGGMTADQEQQLFQRITDLDNQIISLKGGSTTPTPTPTDGTGTPPDTTVPPVTDPNVPPVVTPPVNDPNAGTPVPSTAADQPHP